MDITNTIIIIQALVILWLFICLKRTISEKNIEKYLVELNNKIDDSSNIEKVSYILANEIRELYKPNYIAIIEYTQQNSKILAQTPNKRNYLTEINSHELFLIIKTLLEENEQPLMSNDLKSEHYKNSFPIFKEEKFTIFPLYLNNEKIITLELYGENKNKILFNKEFADTLIETFKKFYLQNAKLHQVIAQNRKDEVIINFFDKIKNSLNETDLENNVLEQVCQIFNADRTYILLIEKNLEKIPIYKNEYLGNLYAKSLIGHKLDTKAVWEQIKSFEIKPIIFAIENSEKFIRQNNFQDTPLAIFLEKSETKSSYPFLIFENANSYLYLIIDFTRQFYVFSTTDFKLMGLLTRQINIAISQAKLHTQLLANNKKEKLLKEILSDTIYLKTKDEIYKYFAEKITTILNANGTVFIELEADNSQKNNYYEYYKSANKNLEKFKNIKLIVEELKENKLFYSCDLKKLSNDKEGVKFLKETDTVCIGAIPVFGNTTVIIFFDRKKDFSDFDRNILFSIIEILSKTIQDILKNAEINSLRETFLSTLSHDLQIPMIAQRNTIKYLLEKNKDYDKTIELLNELLNSNEELENMLKTLMEIYKYESQKKILQKENCDLEYLIKNAIAKTEKKRKNKNIEIILEPIESPIEIWADPIELTESLDLILENIIEYSAENSQIIIKTTKQEKTINCCISSEYCIISDKTKELLFEKDISLKTLEYKIGSGIYLYLAKLILHEHNAKISLDNENKDFTICIHLLE